MYSGLVIRVVLGLWLIFIKWWSGLVQFRVVLIFQLHGIEKNIDIMLASGNHPDNHSHVLQWISVWLWNDLGFTFGKKRQSEWRSWTWRIWSEVNQQHIIIWETFHADCYQSFIIVSHSISDINSFDCYIFIGCRHYDILCDTNCSSWTEIPSPPRALIGKCLGKAFNRISWE